MKDFDVLNEVWEQEVLEDFDGFLAAEDWSSCSAIIEMLGDRGRKNTAVRMNRLLNKAKSLGYLEPHEDVIPLLTEEERISSDLPDHTKHGVVELGWTREGDEKFPPHQD